MQDQNHKNDMEAEINFLCGLPILLDEEKHVTSAGGKLKLDRATILGLCLAGTSILAGTILEGGRIADLLQITAGLVVLGGTMGAVLVSYSPAILWNAAHRLLRVFVDRQRRPDKALDQLIFYSERVRKAGMLHLEKEAEFISDPFLRKALSLAIDGIDTKDIREHMDLEILLEERRLEAEIGVFESAGGYAPTIGIIGAVIGLIQVMKHLDNIHEVGHGIAIAFVSTVYGVGLANLLFLPAAAKLRLLARQEIELREMIVEGVVGIAQGRNSRLLRNKLEAYLAGQRPRPLAKAAKEQQFTVKEGGRR